MARRHSGWLTTRAYSRRAPARLIDSSPRSALAACACLGLVAACNIDEGFRDAGSALFPEQTTYIDAPGVRLLEGKYHSLRLGYVSEPLVFARSAEDDGLLYILKQNEATACTLAGVGRYGTFIDGGVVFVRGQDLHFADHACNESDTVMRDAQFPFSHTARGFVLEAAGSPPVDRRLVAVNPLSGEQSVLVDSFLRAFRRDGINFVMTGRELLLFTDEWDQQASLPTKASWAVESAGDLYVEDDGIHQLLIEGSQQTPTVELKAVDPEACRLSNSAGWLHYYSPCDETRPVVMRLDTQETIALDPDLGVDPRRLKVLPQRPDKDEPIWLIYQRDIDPNTNLGTVYAQRLDSADDELVIGRQAALDWVALSDSDEQSGGSPEASEDVTFIALVDIQGNAGRLVRVTGDGSTLELASSVYTGSSPLEPVVNYNGQVGDYATLIDDELVTVAKRIPPAGFRATNSNDTAYSVFSEYDGITGTLSVGPGPRPRSAEASRVIAAGVPRYFHDFLDRSIGLPGVGYLADFDASENVGRLEYYSVELDFSNTIRQGVSEFAPGFGGIFYILPEGDKAGIHYARAK